MTKPYAHPEVLVETDWVAAHGGDDGVRLVEVDVDTGAYDHGHIPGAIAWDWVDELCDPVRRDVIPPDALGRLLGRSGIERSTTVVLYGDNNNWFACWAFWQLKMYGHNDVRILNGGRRKWIAEGRELTREAPSVPLVEYGLLELLNPSRVFLADVQRAVGHTGEWNLVDVRTPEEYTGRLLAPPGLPETCQRGGHIPGARNVPWDLNCNEDGTFKNADELLALYEQAGVELRRPTITYCRIGERSSLTWFVLRYLLGYPTVRNYDGSWTEWGNLVNAPIHRGESP